MFNLPDAGAVAGSTAAFLIAVRYIGRTQFIQSFRDRRQLVAEKSAAIGRANIAESNVEQIRKLVITLNSRVDALAQEVTALRNVVDALTTRFRLAIRYIIKLEEHNSLIRLLLNQHASEVQVPTDPVMPDKLREAMDAIGPEDPGIKKLEAL